MNIYVFKENLGFYNKVINEFAKKKWRIELIYS